MKVRLPTDTYDKFCDALAQAQNQTLTQVTCDEHLFGIAEDMSNQMLQDLSTVAQRQNSKIDVYTPYIFDHRVKDRYPWLNLALDIWPSFESLRGYRMHPNRCHKNFICSFNGSPHVSRQLLVAILFHMGFYNPAYVSKNLSFSSETIDGNLADLAPQQHRMYRKFFISEKSHDFFNSINSFGFVQYNHSQNIKNLEHQLTDSFVHLVSESMATSYYPFFSEKFIYSVVTRGLFVAYAQPGWHDHIEQYIGFKKYDKIFDYSFDTVLNPVARLISLISMLSKFASLQPHDWHDLYMMEEDTVEFNYQHYHSGDYMRCMKRYV